MRRQPGVSIWKLLLHNPQKIVSVPIKMQVLVLGSSGLAGSRLFDGLSDAHMVCGTYFNTPGPPSRMFKWDILKDQPETLFQRGRPDVIVNTVHPRGLDGAKELLASVFGALGRLCRNNDVHLVHFSSDAVFGARDGVFMESEPASPSSEYGLAKLAIEKVLMESGAPLCRLRISHVFGRYPDKRFDPRLEAVKTVLERREELPRFKNYFKQPLWAGELVRPVKEIIRRRFIGTLHIAGEPHSPYEVATAFAGAFGYSVDLVRPVSKDETGHGRRLCSRSLLCTSKAKNDFGFTAAPLPAAMARAVSKSEA